MKYSLRFVLLMTGVALTTLGLLHWQDHQFSFAGMWLVDNDWRPHPVHLMVLGIAMIPPSMWEIFMLDVASTDRDGEDRRTP